MFLALQVATVLLVAIATALALAHALEWPGKLRLAKQEYFAIQPIYYPGFTIGGVAEPGALLLALVLLFTTPTGTLVYWLTIAGFIALLAMHVTYWVLTHPLNNFWLGSTKLTGAGIRFFAWVHRAPPMTCSRRIGRSCATDGSSRMRFEQDSAFSASSCW